MGRGEKWDVLAKPSVKNYQIVSHDRNRYTHCSSGSHRNNTLLKRLKKTRLWERVYRFLGFWVQQNSTYSQSKYIAQLWFNESFSILWPYEFNDLLCRLSVCNIAGIICPPLKLFSQSAKLLPQSLTSFSLEYTPTMHIISLTTDP